MADLWKKLNLKDQQQVVVLDSPESFEPALEGLDSVTVVRDLRAAKKVEFLIAFVTQQAQIERVAARLGAKAPGDPLIWFAYPKGSSKRYQCDFNRDSGWQSLGDAGFEGVRQVAIDEDWSALRFRRVENIKTMKRDSRRAMTKAGRKKAAKK